MKKKFYCESCKHIAHEKGLSLENSILDIEQGLPVFCDICGQEIYNLTENNSLKKELETTKSALNNKNLHVICFTAPSIRASIGEAFGLHEDCRGKMITALKLLGFDNVFDMNIAADFTTVEEAHEFLYRLQTKTNLPMLTSCCPGWVNYVERAYPQFKNNLSSCKSPQQMFGALINNIYANHIGKKSTELFIVSIVPCLIKKLERVKEDMNTSIGYDVDACITTNELAELIKENNIDFKNLKNSSFDSFFGESTGAGVIFGNTGGVMNAVLGSLGEKDCNKQINSLNTQLKTGKSGIKSGTIKINNQPVKIAIASGLNNARDLLEELTENPNKYDFVEVMACPGGCVGGGGQIPILTLENKSQIIQNRASILYNAAKRKKIKQSNDNPALKQIYARHLDFVGSAKAHQLLHIKQKTLG